MKKNHLFILFAMYFALNGCVGIDFVDDPIQAERLVISPRIDSLAVGETMQFSAEYFNELGQKEEVPIEWSSSDATVVSINGSGEATGISSGPVRIVATAGAAADTLILNTAGTSNAASVRSGTFQNVPGSHYHSSGIVRLEKRDDGSLHLVFADNFSVSAGPSLYCLLANHTNGRYAVSPGNNIVNGASAQITATRLMDFSGARDYIVPVGVNIEDYKYVVFYCTLGPVFGFAELK